MTLVGFVFDVGGRDGDAALLFFRSLIDVVIIDKGSLTLEAGNLGDCSGKSGLTMVDVTDSTNVYVRLFALKFFLTHGSLLKLVTFCGVLHEKHTLSNPAHTAGQPC